MPYYSCDTASRLLRMLLINSYIGRLYNEVSKAYESKKYQTAAIISLEIAFLKGRVGTANFIFLGHRHLKEMTVKEYFNVLKHTLDTDDILKDMRTKDLINFNDIHTFLDFAYPNRKIIDRYKNILNIEDIVPDDKIFERTITILENDLIKQFQMGVISLHKLSRLYGYSFDNSESLQVFEDIYQDTLKMLENKKTELIVENIDVYKAEAHFLKAKVVHLHESRLLDLSKEKALEYYQNALSFNTPRKLIYLAFYLYLKTEIMWKEFVIKLKTIEIQFSYIFVALLLVVLKILKNKIAKALINNASKQISPIE